MWSWTAVLGLGLLAVAAAESEAAVESAAADPEPRVLYGGAQLLRVAATSPQQKEQVKEIQEKQDLERWHDGAENVDLFVPAESLAQVKDSLANSQLQYEVIINDVQHAINSENPPLSEDQLLSLDGRQGHRMTWNYYHRLDDIYGYLDYLAQTYPSLVTVKTIGNTVEGRPLKVVKISSGEPNAKAIWIDGGTHAREWISPASVSYIINQLVENRDNHQDVVKGIDFYILPVLNPDGYEYSHTTDRLWRKNRARNGYCTGTDLNRNWGYKWGGAGSSNVSCKEIYAGSRPFSEPETTAVSKYILANRANMKGFLTFHSYGQYILHPWGYAQVVPPDHAELERLAQRMAAAMYKQGGHEYTTGSSAIALYAAAGGADDWAKGQAGIKYAYTIELADKGRYGFILPASQIQPVAKEALSSVKVMAEAVRNTP